MSVCSAATGRVGIDAVEVEVSRTVARRVKATAPIVAAGTDIVEITNVVVAEARHGQFKC